MRDVFIFNEVCTQDKIYVLKGTFLVEIFYLSVSTGTESELYAA